MAAVNVGLAKAVEAAQQALAVQDAAFTIKNAIESQLIQQSMKEASQSASLMQAFTALVKKNNDAIANCI